MQFGIDRLLVDVRCARRSRQASSRARASGILTRELTHSLDALAALRDVKLSSAFGPQHGLRGDKQDTWSSRRTSPIRCMASRSTASTAPCAGRRGMMASFDVLLVDLQDLGCRVVHLHHHAALCARGGRRPPQGALGARPPQPDRRGHRRHAVRAGWESFVGAGPLPDASRLDDGRARALVRADTAAGSSSCKWCRWKAVRRGWPRGERVWINPSPNAPNVAMARCYSRHGDARRHYAFRGRGRRGRWNCSCAEIERARSSARCGALRRTGCAAASCARLVRADFPQACGQALSPDWQFHAEEPSTRRELPPLALGALRSRRWQAEAAMRCGANLRMNTSAHACAIDLNLTAASSCGAGSTTRRQRAAISTRRPHRRAVLARRARGVSHLSVIESRA